MFLLMGCRRQKGKKKDQKENKAAYSLCARIPYFIHSTGIH